MPLRACKVTCPKPLHPVPGFYTLVRIAKDDAARAFYRKYGFMELPNVERRLLLPMATIEALFAE